MRERLILSFISFVYTRTPPWGASQVVLVVKILPASVRDIRDTGSIPGSGRSRSGHSNPLQYSCQENPVDRVAWWAI